MLSEKALALICQQDTALNKKAGWSQNSVHGFVEALQAHGRVEVGWREACGKTDHTHLVYRAWLKVLKRIRQDGLEIAEERIKHGNAYATMKGGFWSSIVYTVQLSTSR